jgi:dipeptidyl aminopeptidase/acylaminoacyl peptidase
MTSQKRLTTLPKIFYYLLLVLGLLSSSGCGQSGTATPPPDNNPATPTVKLEGFLTAADRLGVFTFDFSSGEKVQTLSGGLQPQRSQNGEIIYVRKDGSQETFIIADAKGNISSTLEIPFLYGGTGFPQYFDPALSPDGSLIAFAAQPFEVIDGGPYTDPYYHLYVMTRDGTLLADLRGYAQPTWTPDGRLVFMGSAPLYEGETGIYVSDADLQNPQRLDGALNAPNSPSVSPDGKQVVFENSGLWLVNLDGTNLRQVLTSDTVLIWPTFSPDGQTVAVSKVRGNSSWLDLIIVPLDESKDPFFVYTSSSVAVDAVGRLSWWK